MTHLVTSELPIEFENVSFIAQPDVVIESSTTEAWRLFDTAWSKFHGHSDGVRLQGEPACN